ncbi:MAG: transporter substrate-binding domain-containing protein [Rhodospirillales bacterium]|nr:transporter substrate-binding domain-containing protein [Rhodospirillales bacterium]
MKFLALILSVFLFLAQAPQTQAADETAYDRVMRTGKMRCGYAMWPPHVLVKDPNSGEIKGMIPDILEQAANNMDMEIEWTEEVGWGSFIESLRSNRIDAFCMVSWPTATRGRYVDYTPPLFYSVNNIYVRADDHRFDDDLSKINDPSVRVSVMDGEMSAVIHRDHFPEAQAVSIPQLAEPTQLLLNVKTGKADVAFMEPGMVKEFLKHNPGALRKVGDKPFQVFPNSIAVLIGEVKLKAMLSTAITELINHGVVQGIVDKYEPDREIFMPVAKPYQALE